MRVNVYGEELTADTELVVKNRLLEGNEAGRQFYGIRLYLESTDHLRSSPTDDDRSAVTLWVPWTKDGGHNFDAVHIALLNMLSRLDEARSRSR